MELGPAQAAQKDQGVQNGVPSVAPAGGGSGAAGVGWHCGHLWLSRLGVWGPTARPGSLWHFQISACNPWGAAWDLQLIGAAI